MLHWLTRLWHKIEDWMHLRHTAANSYHRSNLHGRYR